MKGEKIMNNKNDVTVKIIYKNNEDAMNKFMEYIINLLLYNNFKCGDDIDASNFDYKGRSD